MELAGTRPDARDAAVFHLAILGEFRLIDVRTGIDCTPKSRKSRALIAYLALTSGGPVRRERLAALLWGDRPEEQARTSLRQTLFELRELAADAAPLLVAERDSIGLSHSLLRSDAETTAALANARDIAGLQAALARWQGGLLSDLVSISPEFDEWLTAVRARETESIIAAAVDAMGAVIDAGDPRVRVIVALLQTIEPTNERVLRLGLLADAKAGNSAGLHRRYRDFVDTLRAELSAAPSAETQTLFRSLVPPDVEPIAEAAAPQTVPRTARHPVPAPSVPSTSVEAAAVAEDRPRYSRLQWGLAGAMAVAMVAVGAILLLPSVDRLPAPHAPSPVPESKPTIDPVAYEMYRRGVEASRQRTDLGNVQAEALLKGAVARAPNFSRAWSALAFVQLLTADYAARTGKSPQEIGRWHRAARDSANRAIALDPHNGEPYGILAQFVMSIDMESERLRLIERGLAIEPNSVYLLRSRGQGLLGVGLAEAGLADFRRAHQLDPLDPRTISNLSDALVDSGRVHEARTVLDKGLAIYPVYPHFWRQKLTALLSDGEFDAADAMLLPTAARPAPQWDRAAPGLRLIARALRTRRPADSEAAGVVLRREARIASAGEIDLVVWKMALLGRLDDAFSLVRAHALPPLSTDKPWPTAEEEWGSSDVFYSHELFVDVIFAPFRRDPRFAETWSLTEMTFWQKTGRWPTFCQDAELGYDCRTEAAKAMARHHL